MPASNTVATSPAEIEYVYPDCPLCGTREGRYLFTARDRLIGKPGEFPIVQCPRCDLVYLCPRPSPESLGEFYPDTYYPLDDGQVSSEALGVALGLLDRVRAWVGNQPEEGTHILDVGCGTGLFLKQARDEGFVVQGVEFSQSAANYAARVHGLTVHCGSLADAELDAESFDVVTMWHVLEHLPDPVETLRIVGRLLKPGGLLLFGVPNIASWEARLFGRRWFSLDAPRHLCHFSPATASRTVESAGLHPERVVHSNGTAGLVYSLMGDVTGISLKLRRRELSEVTYLRLARALGMVARPVCGLAARLGQGGAIEVYATKPFR